MKVKQRIRIGYGLALLILLFVSGLAYQTNAQYVSARARSAHSRNIVQAFADVLSNLQDAETGQRGYIITGDDSYLAPYQSASTAVQKNLDHLAKLTADDPQQQKDVAVLKNLIASKFDELQQVIDLRRSQGVEAATQRVMDGRGKTLMDKARAMIAGMQSEEQIVWQRESAEVGVTARRTSRIVIIASLLALILVPAASFLTNREILRRERIERDLVRAKVEAERASRFKDQFLSTMSHELRTPLNAILGFSDLLKEDRYGSLNDRQKRYLDHIHGGGEHLLALINDILDMSKIEAGRMDIVLESVTVGDVIRSVMYILAPLAQAKRQELLYNEPSVLAVRADATRFKQILTNLAGNAIKFTPNGGRIELSAVPNGGNVTVSVQDNGPGIPAAEQQRIFEGFYRMRGSSKTIEGTGLGLAITRRLVELHGSKLELNSQPGEGSCFFFTLPLLRYVPADIPGNARVGQDAAPAKILVIEDDSMAADLIQSHLVSAGYEVTLCKEPQRAFELAATLRPKAITLDILMTPVTGWDLLVKLRNDSRTDDIPIIVVTVVDQRSLGTALGADEYLVKPVERTSLLSAVDRCLKGLTRPLTGCPILVVEDNAETREVISEVLTERGFQVTCAADGQQARERIAEMVPELVDLDLLLPKVSGFDLLAEWRANPRTADMSVFVLTNKDLSPEEESYLRAHAKSLLQKEVHWKDSLIPEIHRVMAHARPQVERV